MDDNEIEKLIKKAEFHSKEELPKGVVFDGENYIIDEDFEGWNDNGN